MLNGLLIHLKCIVSKTRKQGNYHFEFQLGSRTQKGPLFLMYIDIIQVTFFEGVRAKNG